MPHQQDTTIDQKANADHTDNDCEQNKEPTVFDLCKDFGIPIIRRYQHLTRLPFSLNQISCSLKIASGLSFGSTGEFTRSACLPTNSEMISPTSVGANSASST